MLGLGLELGFSFTFSVFSTPVIPSVQASSSLTVLGVRFACGHGGRRAHQQHQEQHQDEPWSL